ncbi:hypothetical protein MNBD_NITROSPINAE03-1469 [hydrothermal vent metagenome]|uniref:SH3b domain-containing protein n=1 Tax=hydrothermal vent metagenome TaxID=652676 RepID=A0A3B1CD62_9ZZZZ
MSKTVSRLMSALVILLFSAAPLFAENIYVEKDNARFRSGPGTNYQILWESPRYTPLEYLAKYKGWYAVRDHDGDVAWVNKQVIGKGVAAIVTNKKANVRKGPGTNTRIVFFVEKGYLFKVTGDKNGWLKVKAPDGDEGWVLAKLVWISK